MAAFDLIKIHISYFYLYQVVQKKVSCLYFITPNSRVNIFTKCPPPCPLLQCHNIFHFNITWVPSTWLDFSQSKKTAKMSLFPKFWKTRSFTKNPIVSLLWIHHSLTSCKKSEKSRSPIPGKKPRQKEVRMYRYRGSTYGWHTMSMGGWVPAW